MSWNSMNIKPIKIEIDHEQTLKRPDAIFDAPANDEAELLTSLAADYANEHYPVGTCDSPTQSNHEFTNF